ncbi:MAG: hypothetical protein WBO46_15260 [Caldilineaceae bacterium]
MQQGNNSADGPTAVAWNIEVWPAATCGGWSVEFERAYGSSSENWRLKLDGVEFKSGTVSGDEIINGFWPSGVDLTSGTHTFRAEIYEGGSWLYREKTFGPCPAQLSIVKSVNPAGSVKTGDTLAYQVVVGNPSNVIQTGIVITDSLPVGVSYIGSSTTAVGTASTNVKQVKDTFASQSYSRQDGPDNWSTNWIETDSGDTNASSGRIYIHSSSQTLRLTDYQNSDKTPGIYRQVDLSGYSYATLSFDWGFPSSIDTDDGVVVEISGNGGSSYTVLETFTGYNTSVNSSRSYNISSYISSNTRVRFRVTQNIGVDDEYFAVDNVQILATGSTSSVTKDNNTSNGIPNLVNGTPPNLVAAADSFTLAPGQTMTVTFQASVTASSGSLVNTAWAKSNEAPNPVKSSVTNNIGSDDELCYAVADGTTSSSDGNAKDTLAHLNRVNGATTIVNNTLGNTNRYNIEAIAFQPGGTTLFAADAGQLGTLNLSTGLFTPTSSSFGSGNGSEGTITFSDVDGLSFDPTNGYLYGTHRRGSHPDVLFRIDPATGQRVNNAFGSDEYVEVSAIAGLEDVDDIAVDPSTGIMYGIVNNGSSSESRLVTINKSTGAATSVGTVKLNGSNIQDIEGLSFFNDGKLYGSSGKSGPTTNALYQINKSTAVATLIGQFPSPLRDIEALGCFTGSASIDVEKSTNGFDADDLPGPSLPAGITVTWSYTATNTGSVTLNNVAIVDDKEGPICTVGTLNAGQSGSCSATGIAAIGQYANMATATGARADNGQIVQDRDPSHYNGVGSNPSYTILKANNTDPDLHGVRLGEPISFTIHIENTGDTPITILPLRDTYIDGILTYIGATPPPDTPNPGQIDWNDLTGATASGFGIDLDVGQSFNLIVEFIGTTDTTNLPGGVTYNTATVRNAFYDPDGPGGLPPQPLPDKSAVAPAKVIAPTSVDVVSAALVYDGDGAKIHWQTFNETSIAGFYLYRGVNGASTEPITTDLIPAQAAGQANGASYAYTDSAVSAGSSYQYELEVVALNGTRTRSPLGILVAGPRIYLPTIGR